MCECLRMTTTTRVDSVSRSDPKMDIRTSATKCVQGNHKTTVSIAIEHTHTLVYLLPDRRLGSHLIKTMRHCDLLERKRERAQRQLFCCCDHQQLGDMLRYTVACGTFFPYWSYLLVLAVVVFSLSFFSKAHRWWSRLLLLRHYCRFKLFYQKTTEQCLAIAGRHFRFFDACSHRL